MRGQRTHDDKGLLRRIEAQGLFEQGRKDEEAARLLRDQGPAAEVRHVPVVLVARYELTPKGQRRGR